MVDLAMTSAELEQRKKTLMADGPDVGDIEKYPWGTQLRLNDAMVKKLNLNVNEIGQEVMFMAKAKVTELEAREEADGDTKRHVTLQLTEMTVQGAAKATNTQVANTLYNQGEEK